MKKDFKKNSFDKLNNGPKLKFENDTDEVKDKVEEKVEEKKEPKQSSGKTYKQYQGNFNQVDAVLAAIGVDNRYRGTVERRKPLAEINGIKNYEGTSEQDAKLVSLAKKGTLKSLK